MKLIDKYLLRTFMVPLMYCLLAFVLLYVVFDLFNNMSDFMEAKTGFSNVAKFYVFLIPSVLIYIIPISLLLSVLYALWSLTKSNELVAMRACGISIFRLMVPLLVIGFLFSAGVAVVHETVGPWSAYWTYTFLKSHKGDTSVHVATMLGLVNQAEGRDWIIGRFDTRTRLMENVTINQEYPDGSSAKIQAREGKWLDGRWWFTEVVTQKYDSYGNPRGRVQFESRRQMSELTETPEDFINEIKDPLENPEYVSAAEITKFIETHRLSDQAIARLRVDMQHRLSMPWTCLIVTMLGIPFGTTTARRGAFLGIVSAIAMFFAFYIFVNVALALGKKGVIEPWVAAWLPNITFFCIGAVLVYRMR